METFGKGGKGGSTRKKQKLVPVFNINATAGNDTAYILLTSDRNTAIARSKSTHAKEEKAREIKLQEEIDEAIRISLGVSKPSNPGQVIELNEDEEEDKKPSVANQPTVLGVDSDSEEEEDTKPSADQLPPPAAPSADLDTLIISLINFLESGLPITNEYLDLFTAIRNHPSSVTVHFQQIQEAFQNRLLGDYERGTIDNHIIPKRAIAEYASDIGSATPGQEVTCVQLLCPVNRRGMFISYAAGDTRPAGFNPDTCATTRGLEKLLNRLRAKSNHKTMTGEVRWKCEEDCCGGRKHCKKCTVAEGGALSKVYNLLALFYYVTGGEMNFFNVGGVSTKIKENLAAHLIPEYFGMIEARGYHLSLLAYLSSCFGTFKNGATILTTWVKDLCDKMGIPEAVYDLIKDKRLPMVVDLKDIDNAEREWKSDKSQAYLENYNSRSVEWKAAFHTARGKDSWEARVKKDGIEAAHAYMRTIGSLGGVASFEARLEAEGGGKKGYAAMRDKMSEMGKIGGRKKRENMVARVGIDGANAVMKSMASEGGNAFRDQEVQKYGEKEANRRLKDKLKCNPGLKEMQRRNLLGRKRKEAAVGVEQAAQERSDVARKRAWANKSSSDRELFVNKEMKKQMAKLQKKGVDFHFIHAECLHCYNFTTGIVNPTVDKVEKTCQHCNQNKKTTFPRNERYAGKSGPKSKHWKFEAMYVKGSSKYGSIVEALNEID